MHVIRKRIQLQPDQAMFLFVNNTMPASGKLMSEIYKEHAEIDKDGNCGFLYMNYCGDSAFGN